MSLSDALCRSYLDLRWHLDPAAATAAGVPGQDDRLGAFDEASLREHLAAFRAIEAGIEELPIEDPAEEIDRTALLDEVRVAIFRLQYERPHRRNPAFWLLHLAEALAALRPVDDPARARSARARLRAIPDFLRTASATLHEPPAAFVELAEELIAPAAALVEELAEEAAGGGGLPDEGPDLRACAHAAAAALAGFRQALEAGLARPADQHAVGVGLDQFERLLHHLHAITAGAAELWRAVSHLEADTEAALQALAAESGPGRTWRAELDQALEEGGSEDLGSSARRELERLNRLLGDRADLPAPVETLPQVAALPPHLAPVTGLAAYRDCPPPARLLLRPAEATRRWLGPLVADQGIPGLHLELTRAAAAEGAVRRQLGGPLSRGGWGLYMLELLDRAGGWPTPRARLVGRAYLLLRVLLAKADIGLHTRRFGPEEATRLLCERLPLEPPVARALVWECCLAPTQATGAVIGRRELLRLQDDACGPAAAGPSLREHLARVLDFGLLPVPLVRWGMGFEG